MASTVPMEAPICLVENSNGELIVNQQGLQILTSITKPVVVVAIVGMYRTGKSYLMNKLAGKNKGFSLGSTVQSHTKGIWMWCVPHPIKSDHTLVLLDTEGLGDVEKGDSKNDSWIFALAILLSSTFVYNSMNTINHQALEQMQYVKELTELIKVKSSPNVVGEDSAEFVGFFPDFVWTVRDFTLELELDGRPITPDEYLENALKLSKGEHPKIHMANLPRECIRKFFPKRKCFTFDRPTNNRSILAHLEDVQESQLEPAFKDQAENFCSYIFSNAKPKTLSGGIMVNGNRLGKLLETYVKTISRGDIPCLENAVLALAQTENSAAVQKATNHYVEQMKLRVDFPTETLQDLLNLHTDCEKEAISIFMKHSFKDDTNKFKKELVENLESKKDDFICQNEEESTKYCQSKLENLSQTLILAISQGTYSVPGGYQLYRKEREKIMNDYHQLPRKGVKADEVLQKFLQSLAMTEEAILQTDQALTEQEKALEVEQVKREAAEKEKKLLEQQQMEMQQKMEAQQRSYEENIKQLKQKMEEDRKQILKEQEAILDHKLKVTMASTVPMEAPICLVENSNGELIVNQQGLQILTSITKPVVVVAIVGMYRTGKSYLMNKLAGKNKGFSLGSTVQSHTKGIWMWCVPHPIKFDHTLVLLDTEGLRDVEKGDSKNDSWIFALAILLSSTFIYNSMNTINHQALEQMQYVTELTELIKVKSSPNVVGEDSAEFVGFFPDFVWTVRDFTLELKLNGLPITPDEYLENALKLSKGNHRKIQMANLPRECIRKFFPKRKCFTFDRPTNNKSILAHLEDVQESQLEPAFKDQAENFCSYIFSNAKPKTLSGGIMVNGNRLGKLLETYVKTISRGDIPCLENAVLALAQTENSAAVQKATNHYVEQMKLRVDFPTETLQDLLNLHTDCEKEAISIFMKHSFKDDTNKFKKELVADEVLQKFLQSLAMTEEAILQTDQALTEQEKALEVEQVKREAAEKEKKLLEQQQMEMQQKMEAQQRSYEENIKQLKQKMEEDRKQILKEQEAILDHKLKEQKRLMEEGFHAKAKEMEKQMKDLQEKFDAENNKSQFSSFLDHFSNVLMIVLPGAGKLLGLAMKLLSKAVP
ncbi:guanylate-binding protein 7-like isoform X2 [Notamacropus eugenii]|uniref:guanylate-binding protein 7-like isoform X2 n=1 Tax=Notamacropus eugenii TaxID=9315 RepID=UPI003B685F49